MKPRLLFWQPARDYLRLFNQNSLLKLTLIILNYLIWAILFYVSFILVRHSPHIFWQILLATLSAEIFEKYLKSKIFWRRPMFVRHDRTPAGLVDSWYQTGSFPSGHTLKSTYFFLFLLQYQIFPPWLFLVLVIPLLLFRVIIGFHYPADLLGGVAIGVAIWLLNSWYVFPDFANRGVNSLFHFFFFFL